MDSQELTEKYKPIIFTPMMLLGLIYGMYFAYVFVNSMDIIQWNWYQPTEGPHSGGQWIQGPSGQGGAALLFLLIPALSMYIAYWIAVGFICLINNYYFPLYENANFLGKSFLHIFLTLCSAGGFYLGFVFIRSLIHINGSCYYLHLLGRWNFEFNSSASIPIVLIIFLSTITGFLLGTLMFVVFLFLKKI